MHRSASVVAEEDVPNPNALEPGPLDRLLLEVAALDAAVGIDFEGIPELRYERRDGSLWERAAEEADGVEKQNVEERL